MANVQTLPDPDEDEAGILARYKEEIRYYEKESMAWDERARKILRRYKDERSPREMKVARFNILYSNVQTLLPAIYGKNPKADIERRFKDDDVLGRVTSEVLERTTDYFTNTEAFRSSLRGALFDRLTAGRGSVWSRYVPHFRDAEFNGNEEESELGDEIGDNIEEMAEGEDEFGRSNDVEPLEEVYFEEVNTDYVHWADIGHNWARIWDEIYLLWRKVYLDKKELQARFGKEIASMIPMDYYPKGLNDQKKETAIKKAVIYECWDKSEKKVRWVHKDVPQFLDEKDDPLKLPDFFPCPKPLYAVLANDTMIPVPDYSEYQDQANELDELTSRIAAITKSVKVAGVYDASAAGVERLLAEGVENKLIPVEQWAVHAEKGGLKGVMDFMPIEGILNALLGLYECRDKVKNDLYEITGIADILRGQSDPQETATAVTTKGRFATLRLGDNQDEMARFARDAVKNAAVIIANHFSIDTIKKISGVKLLTDQEKQQIQMQEQQAQIAFQQANKQHQMAAQVAQAHGQTPPPPPPQPPAIPDDLQELLTNPSWEDVERILRDEPSLSFKIDIETDSTIKMDEEAEKASRVEFLKATGEFMAQMKDAPPIAMPLLAHMLMFGIRAFPAGRQIEGQFQIFADKVEKMAANAPTTPPPNPAMVKVQADIQEQQARAQADEADAQRDAKMKMAEQQQQFQFKQAELKQKYDLEMAKMKADAQIEMQKHQITMQTNDAIGDKQRAHDTHMQGMLTPDEHEAEVKRILEAMAAQHNANTQMHNNTHKVMIDMAQGIKNLHEHASKPKTVTMQARDGSLRTATVQ